MLLLRMERIIYWSCFKEIAGLTNIIALRLLVYVFVLLL